MTAQNIFLPKRDLREWLGIERMHRPPLKWYVGKSATKGILKKSSDAEAPTPSTGLTKLTALKKPGHPTARRDALRAARKEEAARLEGVKELRDAAARRDARLAAQKQVAAAAARQKALDAFIAKIKASRALRGDL